MSGWLGETLIATALLMAAVLLLRAPVRRAFGSGAAYALWLVPALRLALPPVKLPAIPEIVGSGSGEIVWAAAAAAGAPAAGWLFPIWAAGAAVFAAWQVVCYRRFVRRALAGAASEGGANGVEVVRSDAVCGPAAIGLLTRRILLPCDFDARFTPAERELALAHEHVHHARGDLWANAAALGVLALHWFNPLAHRAYRAFREDQELSCDAAVIAAAGTEARAAYGAAMVKAAHDAFWKVQAAPKAACPMTRFCNLKRRLKMVGMHKKTRAASVGGALAVGALALAGLTLTATGGIAAEPAATVKKITIKKVDGAGGLADALGKELGEKCGSVGDRFETNADTRQGGKPVKTVFVLCNKADASPADRLATLGKARARIVADTHFDAEQRGRILSALDSAIAKLKAE